MAVTVTFECNDCDEKAGPFLIHRLFRSFSGRSHGVGKHYIETIEDKAPEGWTVFDHIGATYCPRCSGELGALNG